MQNSEFVEDDDLRNTLPSPSSSAAGGFRPVGSFAQAVVMKLKGGLPKIKVESASREEDRHSR